MTLRLDRSTRHAAAGDIRSSVLPPWHTQDIRDPARDRATLPALTAEDQQASKVTLSEHRG